MHKLERLDRRAFLRGMMVTSAGLVVPKPASVVIPNMAADYAQPCSRKWTTEFTLASKALGVVRYERFVFFSNGRNGYVE